MNLKRIALLVSLAVGIAGVSEVPAAPASIRHGVAASPAGHARGQRPGPGVRWSRNTRNPSHWGWGLGLAIGVPWALGWYDPWWGSAYYAPYTYGPVYRRYGLACEQDEDCWREHTARVETAAPATEVAPVVPGENGGPTQRPLHLNYCDTSRAWFPHVRTCPGGWRLVLPDYGTAR